MQQQPDEVAINPCWPNCQPAVTRLQATADPTCLEHADPSIH